MNRKQKRNGPAATGADAPVLRTEEDYRQRDLHAAAYVLVSAALVEPVWRLVRRLPTRSSRGELARAIELLLVGLDEEDFTIIGTAMAELMTALKVLGRQRVLTTVDELARLAQLEGELARPTRGIALQTLKQHSRTPEEDEG